MSLIVLSLILVPLAHAKMAFNDMASTDADTGSITYMYENGLMKGYSDDTFRSDRTISRAEFTKVLVLAVLGEPEQGTACRDFKDVKKTDWFLPYVCVAKAHAFIEGFDDGTFRPYEKVSVAEASAMIARAFDLEQKDGQPWFKPFIEALSAKQALPDTIETPYSNITRGETAAIIYRLKNAVMSESSDSADTLLSAQCDWFTPDPIPGVDLEEVRRVWLMWVNDVRTENGRKAYTLNKQLTRSATIWSQRARDLGAISHKRPGQTAYYDYGMIKDWFENQGLTFKNVNRITYSENIGWGPYACSSGDCTAKFIAAMRTTFDFFMSEKATKGPHYESIMNASFNQIGVGLAYNASQKDYYITVHYGTVITSDPDPVCP